MPRLTAARAKQIWDDLVIEYVQHMLSYLQQVEFDKDGKMRADEPGSFVHHRHWNLVKEWKKRIKEMGKG